MYKVVIEAHFVRMRQFLLTFNAIGIIVFLAAFK